MNWHVVNADIGHLEGSHENFVRFSWPDVATMEIRMPVGSHDERQPEKIIALLAMLPELFAEVLEKANQDEREWKARLN